MDELLEIVKPMSLVLAGWLLSNIKDFWKSKKDDRSALNFCLSNLLEVRYLIQRTDVVTIADNLLVNMVKEFPELAVDGVVPPFVKKQFEHGVQLQVTDMILSRYPKIKDDYDKSLEGLKPIDPILAHRLSGRTEFANYVNQMGAYLDKIDPSVDNSVLKDEMLDFISPRLRSEILEATENDIKVVAKKISLFTFYRVKKELKRSQSKFDDNQDLQEYYTELRKKFGTSLTQLPPMDEISEVDLSKMLHGDVLSQFQDLILEHQKESLPPS